MGLTETCICETCQSEFTRPLHPSHPDGRKFCNRRCSQIGRTRPISERLAEKYIPEPNSGCWLYLGQINDEGYGVIRMPGDKHSPAHRASYENEYGPIVSGLPLDHLCRNRPCGNPSHLEPVTHRENGMRGNTLQARNARKTHCKRGHAFTPENTYLWRTSRICRRCRAERDDMKRQAS